MSTIKLPERQRDVLAALAIDGGWVRPMDVGASDGSHHGMTLRALVKKELAERKLRGSLLNQIRGTALYERLAKARSGRSWKSAPRGSYEYRITNAGRAAIKDRGTR